MGGMYHRKEGIEELWVDFFGGEGEGRGLHSRSYSPPSSSFWWSS